MRAYVLINIRTGSIKEVVRHLQSIAGVVEANMTLGPYDAVVIVEAADIKHLGDLLATKIQPIPGVLETLTCMSVGN